MCYVCMCYMCFQLSITINGLVRESFLITAQSHFPFSCRNTSNYCCKTIHLFPPDWLWWSGGCHLDPTVHCPSRMGVEKTVTFRAQALNTRCAVGYHWEYPTYAADIRRDAWEYEWKYEWLQYWEKSKRLQLTESSALLEITEQEQVPASSYKQRTILGI